MKDKLEKDMEFMRISRSKANIGAPKGGKRILEEERERRTNSDYSQFQIHASHALLNSVQLNPGNNGPSFTNRNQSLASIHPKSVLEWATKQDTLSAIPSETGMSSLMRNAA